MCNNMGENITKYNVWDDKIGWGYLISCSCRAINMLSTPDPRVSPLLLGTFHTWKVKNDGEKTLRYTVK